MQTKRLIVLGASLVIGAIVTWIIIYAYIPLGPITIGFGTNMKDFAYSNVALLFIAIAAIAAIWLDYVLDTKFLKS
ncbi:MAG: hypothetical protein IT318_23225 [Anaerolineales bacterium]|nr:hypothetical protein [Anaerolineales bacterium]